VARRYQRQGAPVVSVMPAALWGPHDPHFGEGVTRATNVLKGRYPIIMRGGMHIADVRDVAALLAAVMTPGQGPRSYMLAGDYIWFPDLIRTLADLTGRRIRFAIFPAWFLAGFGRAADVVQRRVRTRLPWDAEGIWVMNCAARCDDSQTRGGSSLAPRPLRDTLADAVRWLVEVGHLSPRQAGRLAERAPTTP
jgi:dihydroflavonol-4-reductase